MINFTTDQILKIFSLIPLHDREQHTKQLSTSYLIGFETSVVTMTTNCRDVLTRRNEHPNTKHPSEYVSFVANVTNASRFSAKRNAYDIL